MEYNKTAAAWNLLPEEIKLLKEFFESRTYQLWLEMEKLVKESAQERLEFAQDVPTMCRAQGILEGFRLRDGSLRQIAEMAQMEEENGEV